MRRLRNRSPSPGKIGREREKGGGGVKLNTHTFYQAYRPRARPCPVRVFSPRACRTAVPRVADRLVHPKTIISGVDSCIITGIARLLTWGPIVMLQTNRIYARRDGRNLRLLVSDWWNRNRTKLKVAHAATLYRTNIRSLEPNSVTSRALNGSVAYLCYNNIEP